MRGKGRRNLALALNLFRDVAKYSPCSSVYTCRWRTRWRAGEALLISLGWRNPCRQFCWTLELEANLSITNDNSVALAWANNG